MDNKGRFSGSMLLFNTSNDVTMILRNIIDNGTYSKINDDLYYFQFTDGNKEEVHIQDNTLILNDFAFFLNNGTFNNSLVGTIWSTKKSAEGITFVLSCDNASFKVEPVTETNGTYKIYGTRVNLNFPNATFNANLKATSIIDGDILIVDDLKFVRN
jgi:hypothetical protein